MVYPKISRAILVATVVQNRYDQEKVAKHGHVCLFLQRNCLWIDGAIWAK